jgi:hypothetical protein
MHYSSWREGANGGNDLAQGSMKYAAGVKIYLRGHTFGASINRYWRLNARLCGPSRLCFLINWSAGRRSLFLMSLSAFVFNLRIKIRLTPLINGGCAEGTGREMKSSVCCLKEKNPRRKQGASFENSKLRNYSYSVLSLSYGDAHKGIICLRDEYFVFLDISSMIKTLSARNYYFYKNVNEN